MVGLPWSSQPSAPKRCFLGQWVGHAAVGDGAQKVLPFIDHQADARPALVDDL
jgi:hypothetical protein